MESSKVKTKCVRDECKLEAAFECGEGTEAAYCEIHARSCCRPLKDRTIATVPAGMPRKDWSILPVVQEALTTTVAYDPTTKPAIDGKGVKGVMKAMKCPLELIPPQFTEGVAEILKFGAQKYAPNNWMRGMSWETVAGGMARHLSAFRRGEEMDPESGLPHLYHLSCGAMFLSYYAHGPQAADYRKFDDRLYTAKAVTQ